VTSLLSTFSWHCLACLLHLASVSLNAGFVGVDKQQILRQNPVAVSLSLLMWFYADRVCGVVAVLILLDAMNCVRFCFLALSVTLLFMYEISWEPLNRFAPNSHGRHVWSLARTSLNVKVKGQGHQTQRSRLPETKKWHFFGPFSRLHAVCLVKHL